MRKIPSLMLVAALIGLTALALFPARAEVRPAWQTLPFTDVRSGKNGTLADFAGKTVVVEAFATWCTNCGAQLAEVSRFFATLDPAKVVYLALAVDPTEDLPLVKQFAETKQYPWLFAVSSRELTTALVEQFGRTITSVSSVPKFILRSDATFTELKTGFEDTQTLTTRIADEAVKGRLAATAAPTSAATPSAENRPAWQMLKFKDTRSDKEYTFADFAGKTVIVETFATWCPNCRRQLDVVAKFYPELDKTKVVYVTLGIDPTEDAVMIAKYASDSKYEWLFAISNRELTTALVEQFGRTVTNPTSTPIFAIGPTGKASELTEGLRGPDDFKQLIQDNS